METFVSPTRALQDSKYRRRSTAFEYHHAQRWVTLSDSLGVWITEFPWLGTTMKYHTCDLPPPHLLPRYRREIQLTNVLPCVNLTDIQVLRFASTSSNWFIIVMKHEIVGQQPLRLSPNPPYVRPSPRPQIFLQSHLSLPKTPTLTGWLVDNITFSESRVNLNLRFAS